MATSNRELDQLIGTIVKGDPQRKDTPKGDVVVFTVVRDKSYDKEDANRGEFIDVEVWNEKLQGLVMDSDDIYKGAKVALVGGFKDNTNSKYNRQFRAFEVMRAVRLEESKEF